jgi:hypothetical protein
LELRGSAGAVISQRSRETFQGNPERIGIKESGVISLENPPIFDLVAPLLVQIFILLFWGFVSRRAGIQLIGIDEAKVTDNNLHVGVVDEHILKLHIPVGILHLMHVGQSSEDLIEYSKGDVFKVLDLHFLAEFKER